MLCYYGSTEILRVMIIMMIVVAKAMTIILLHLMYWTSKYKAQGSCHNTKLALLLSSTLILSSS